MVVLRGTVEFFDIRKGFGNIKGPDEKLYFFSKNSLQGKGKPERQQEVDFQEDNEQDVKEGQKPIAVEVAAIEGEAFSTERRRKPKTESESNEGGEGSNSGRGSVQARLAALEKGGEDKLSARLDKIVGKINEICDHLELKRLSKTPEKSGRKGSGRKGRKGSQRRQES